MRVRFLKLKTWLASSLLAALGLSACHSHKPLVVPEGQDPEPVVEPREEIRLMYGVPTMNFMIRGQVKDAEGKPLRDIRVNLLDTDIEATADTVFGDADNVRAYLHDNAVATDADGRFEISTSGLPRSEVRLLVRDVDGAANGSYKNQLLNIKVDEQHTDRSQSNGWYQGSFSTDVDVNLNAK